MPLARSISVTSLSGLDEWDEEFELEDAVLFEIAWEVANKGTLQLCKTIMHIKSDYYLQPYFMGRIYKVSHVYIILYICMYV